jgi:ABC-2 type transport system permease protein
MSSLVRTEWLKLRKYRAFWWILLIVILTYTLINWIFFNIYLENLHQDGMASSILRALGNPFSFPEVWHTVAYASSFSVIIPAVVVIMFISNEYTYKTHRQNIIDGWSRNQFMTAKMVDVFLVSLVVTIIYTVVALIIGFKNEGNTNGEIWGKANYIYLVLLQLFSQLSLAFLVAFFVKRAFIALGIFVFYYFAEQVGAAYLNAKYDIGIEKFLPMEVSDRLIWPPPFIGKTANSADGANWYAEAAHHNYHILYTIILLIITWGVCYYFNKKRDL